MKLKILIAEDEKVTQAIYKKGLSENLFTMRLAENGQRALEEYKEWNPDILLLDYSMPLLNGYQVLRTIRETEGDKKVSIIMVTADSDKANIIACAKLGIHGYIVKPFKANELSAKIIQLYKTGTGNHDIEESRGGAQKMSRINNEDKNSQQPVTRLSNETYNNIKAPITSGAINGSQNPPAINNKDKDLQKTPTNAKDTPKSLKQPTTIRGVKDLQKPLATNKVVEDSQAVEHSSEDLDDENPYLDAILQGDN